MRRILQSVVVFVVCALACVAMTAWVAPRAVAAPAQNPSPPDSSDAPPSKGDELGPGPEVGPEPSQQPPAEPPPSEQPPPSEAQPGAGTQSAPTTGVPSDSTHTGAPADSSQAAALSDTTNIAPSAVMKPAAEAPFDTLSLPGTGPAPTNSSAGPAVGGARPSTPPPVLPPKARTGVFGIHPVAILFGLAALNYFIIKWATN